MVIKISREGDPVKKQLSFLSPVLVSVAVLSAFIPNAFSDQQRLGKIGLQSLYDKNSGEDVSYSLAAHYEGWTTWSFPDKYVLAGKIEIPIGQGKYVQCEFDQTIKNLKKDGATEETAFCMFVKPYRVKMIATITGTPSAGSDETRTCSDYDLEIQFYPQEESGKTLEPFKMSHRLNSKVCTFSPVTDQPVN
jgi:hypothetical protein